MHTREQRGARSAREGLTLVEIIMAVGVLSIFLVGMFATMASAQRADVLTRERAAASEAAYTMLDTIMTSDFDAVSDRTLAFNVEFDTGRAGGQPFLTPAQSFPTDIWTAMGQTAPTSFATAGVAVTRAGVEDFASDTENPDLMEIRVMVAWRAADGSDQRIDVTSRRTR